jgi:ABC-type polysaccharide/polyol phosphate transport system ATPase subunit
LAEPLELTMEVGDDAPVVSIEAVSRRYAQLSIGRTRRAFSKLGGIEGDPGSLDDDDDDDDDGGFDDLEEAQTVVTAGTLALDAVSLRISGGGCVALVGPPGAGKSVLLRTIAGLTPPGSGRVVVKGLVAPILASLSALLSRQGRLGTALPVLAALLHLPKRQVRQRLPQIFAFLGDPEAGAVLVSGLPTRRRQDLLFAAMLCLDPDIVLVDCKLPIGAFGQRCRDRLLELKDAGTLILISARSREEAAWIADRVVYMNEGRIVGADAVDRDAGAIVASSEDASDS